MPKKLFIKTYGCQMNAYDSARMADVLAGAGYRPTPAPEEAELVILNTCHIREKAAEKVYSELGSWRALKRRRAAEGRQMMIAVAGCVAQAEGEEIVARAPGVDIVLGPQTYHRLPELIDRARAAPGAIVATDFPAEAKFDALPEERRRRGVSAPLVVQEGCDRFCTFCVVPYTRGAEYSRPAADVLAEARRLVGAGTREVVLLGQNVNAYHGRAPDGGGTSWSLARLVHALGEIEGLVRIRYTTSHPRDMGDDLIAAHRDEPKLMPYLHLPVQSGSDRVLAAMNRRHRVADYLRLVARLRAARPDLALSSDFIVGFPGETEADFEATLALVGELRLAQAFSFKYSPRPGTPAAARPDQVPEAVKAQRLRRLQAALAASERRFNEGFVGRLTEVLLERPGRYRGQILGRTPYMQWVHLEAPDALAGELCRVRITARHAHSLAGALVGDGAGGGGRGVQ